MHDVLQPERSANRLRSSEALVKPLSENLPWAIFIAATEASDLEPKPSRRPWAGRSLRHRSYRLWTCVDVRPHTGQDDVRDGDRATATSVSPYARPLDNQAIRQ